MKYHLNQKLLDLCSNSLDLRGELRTLVGQNGARYDGPRDTACASQSNFGRHEHVRNVLLTIVISGEVKSRVHGFATLTLSSHSRGRWRRISSGSVSAAIIIRSVMPLIKKKRKITIYYWIYC